MKVVILAISNKNYLSANLTLKSLIIDMLEGHTNSVFQYHTSIEQQHTNNMDLENTIDITLRSSM